MANIRSTIRNIFITNPPEGLTPEQRQALIDSVAAKGEFNGSFEDAVAFATGFAVNSTMFKRAMDMVLSGGEMPTASEGGLASMLEGAEERDPTPEAAGGLAGLIEEAGEGGEEASKTDIGGILGGATRGVLPTMVGKGLGMLAQSAATALGVAGSTVSLLPVMGAAVVALGDPVTSILNRVFGTNYSSPRQGLHDLLTRIGVREPDTKVEFLIENGFKTGADLLALAGPVAKAGAETLALGHSPLSAPGGAENFLTQIGRTATGPAVLGEVAEGFGHEGGRNLGMAGAEAVGIENPVIQESIGAATGVLGGGIFGGLTEGGLEAWRRARQAINFTAAKTPAGTRSPYSKSELEAPTTMQANEQRNFGEGIRRGAGEYRWRRFNENQQMVVNVLDDYDVPVDALGNVPDYSRPLMADFQRTRGADLELNTGIRDGVINQLTDTGATINPERGVARLDALIDAEVALGASDSARIGKMWTDLRNDITGAIHDPETGMVLDDINPRTMDQLQAVRKRFAARLKEQDMPDDMQQELRGVYKEIFGSYDQEGARIAGDIDDFILANGTQADLDQFLAANKRLHEMATEFDSKAMAGILDEWTKSADNIRPEVVMDALFSHDASQVQHLYANLSEDGRAVARRALISKFGETANTTDMSPTLFAESVRKYGEQVGVFFDENQVKELAGLKTHFDMTKHSEAVVRVGRGYEGFPTSTISPGAGTLQSMAVRQNPVIGGVVGLAATVGLSRWTRHIDQQPQIRRMLRELADLTPGSESSVRLSRLITMAIDQSLEDQEEAPPSGLAPIPRQGPTTIPSWLPHSTP